MPQGSAKVLSCYNYTSNVLMDQYPGITKMFADDPTKINSSGNPVHYSVIDSVVTVQPSTDLSVSTKSSSTLDSTQKVTVKGFSGSVELTETQTLSGTTEVPFTTQFNYFTNISIDSACTGYVKVYDASYNYAIIAPGETVAKCKVMIFYPYPDGVYTMYVSFMQEPQPMRNDSDYPILPISDILETGAKADANSYQRREATANKYESLYESMIATYIWKEENQPNRVTLFQPKPYSRDTVGTSSRLDGYNT